MTFWAHQNNRKTRLIICALYNAVGEKNSKIRNFFIWQPVSEKIFVPFRQCRLLNSEKYERARFLILGPRIYGICDIRYACVIILGHFTNQTKMTPRWIWLYATARLIRQILCGLGRLENNSLITLDRKLYRRRRKSVSVCPDSHAVAFALFYLEQE